MISRLTATAALFAVLATAGIAFAADAQQRSGSAPAARPGCAAVGDVAGDVVTLPAVTVIGRRAAR